MEKISINKFKEICDSSDKYKYILESENQGWEDAAEIPYFRLVFDNASVCWYPCMHTIKLFDDKNSLFLSRVKEIYVEEEHPVCGIKYIITCGGFLDELKERKYTIFAKKK